MIRLGEHATASFELKNWEENAYAEPESGPKLTRASVTGKFEGGSATADIVVIPRSGTEELEGLSGEGRFEAPEGKPESSSITLDYDVD